jgi:hypothetical protein
MKVSKKFLIIKLIIGYCFMLRSKLFFFSFDLIYH